MVFTSIDLRLSSIYVHDRLVYSAYWGLAKLDRILEGGETDLFDKDMTDFRSIAMAILDKIGDQSIGKKEFLGLLERKATLEELLKSTFIENAYFPTMDDEFKRLCAAGYDEIGSGASGSVVRIREGNQYFAIKQVNFKPEELETVRKEALMQKRASENCMYIARYYGFWIEKNATKDGDTLSLFIKMEYCETPLFKSLHSRPLEEKLTYIKPLLLGTKSIHEKNIVHGDLKTDNIFISDTLKIADFGVSKSDGEKKKDLQNLAHIIYELYTERVTVNKKNK